MRLVHAFRRNDSRDCPGPVGDLFFECRAQEARAECAHAANCKCRLMELALKILVQQAVSPFLKWLTVKPHFHAANSFGLFRSRSERLHNVSLLPLATFDWIEERQADEACRAWGHYLGACERPFRQEWYGLWP